MADVFKLSGEYATSPSYGGQSSGDAQVESYIDERMTLSNKSVQNITLDADAVTDVDFCGLTTANVLVIKTVGGKVGVRVTSADGATQAVPVDSFLVLISRTVGFTAIDLERVAGVQTTVKIFMGQLAT